MPKRHLSPARARDLARRSAAVRRAKRADPAELRRLSILDVMEDAAWFGQQFASTSWAVWKVFLAALFGLPLTDAQLATFQQFTGRTAPPRGASREAWLIVGRRGGKSRIAALVAVFLACFRDYSAVLAPGERGTVIVLAADKKQARNVFRYVAGLLDSVPALASLVEVRRKESIDLRNGVSIEVHTASYRTVRGYTAVAVIADEVAFWQAEGTANPDREVLDALRPGMATVPGSLLLGISTPYARRGEVWKAYQRHYGQGSDVLVWKADTRAMNPLVDQAVIAAAYEDDPIAAAAEYGADFRRDVEAFISPEALDAVVVLGRLELPPVAGVGYVGFVDPSGGSQDAMTLAVAHLDGDVAVLDCVRERRPPFSPDGVCQEFADVLKSYGVLRVRGDRYAGEWPRERFTVHGVTYEVSPAVKSDIYKAMLPVVNSGRVQLLDHRVLRAQLEGLERRTARGGKDSVDHAPGGRDDVANAAAGALVLALSAPVVDYQGLGEGLAQVIDDFRKPEGSRGYDPGRHSHPDLAWQDRRPGWGNW